MKVAVLTSSRADYGIYQPLLRRLEEDTYFDLDLIVFGTHLSEKFGFTVSEIHEDGFNITEKIKTVYDGDSPEIIGESIGNIISKFTRFWKENGYNYNIIFCLGDRYEMFAAVQAGSLFDLPFAHIHGGETSLGAIDNMFRHCISLMSSYHFTSHKEHSDRVRSITGTTESIYTVGALSLDNLADVQLCSLQGLKDELDVDLSRPTILFTFHPETKRVNKNGHFINEIVHALKKHSQYQVLITGTNADPGSEVIRQKIKIFASQNSERVTYKENLGIRRYFSCMKYCAFMMGNTSSGIIEAASFGKYVINLGDRQKGRKSGDNVMNVAIERNKISDAIKRVSQLSEYKSGNPYWHGGAADLIVDILKNNYNG